MRMWVLGLLLLSFGCGNTSIPWAADSSPTPSNSSPAPSPTPQPQFTYRTTVTIDGNNIPSTLTDFPVVIDITDNRFRHVSNGGHVADGGGDDIAFSMNGSPLEWDLERHDDNNGELVAWVLIPTLTPNQNVDIDITYGDPTINGQQFDPTAVWDPSFLAVWHLDDSVMDESMSMNEHPDSTGNGYDGDQNGNNDRFGKMARGQEFDGDDRIELGDVLDFNLTDTFAISLWVRKDEAGDAVFVAKKATIGPATGYSLGAAGFDSVFTVADGISDHEVGVSAALTMGDWHYLVAVYEFTQPVQIYVDGNDATEVILADPLSNLVGGFGNGLDLLFGDTSNGGYGLVGRLDEIRIETTDRGADWYKTCYLNQNDPGSFYSVGEEVAIPIE